MIERDGALVIFGSWEDRFLEGGLTDIASGVFSTVFVLFYGSYADTTEGNRAKLRAASKEMGITYEEVSLEADQPSQNLLRLDEMIGSIEYDRPISINISTMPRDVIWHIFWLCEERTGNLRYRYYSPKEYAKDWLSRDPGRPRLVHKLSGVAVPPRRTVLVLAVGYDVQRVRQLMRFFEPAKTMLALQAGSRFRDNEKMMRGYDGLGGRTLVETFAIDAFAGDHGYVELHDRLQDVVDAENVILGSLGPKLTAVAVYRIQRLWPDVGLVYAPANQFNPDYSTGTGDYFCGELT